MRGGNILLLMDATAIRPISSPRWLCPLPWTDTSVQAERPVTCMLVPLGDACVEE